VSFFKNFYILALAELAVVQIGSALILTNLQITIGLLVGWLVAMSPFVSWHLIIKMTNGFQSKEKRIHAVLLGLGKYVFIIALLFVLVKLEMIQPDALIAGTVMVVPCLLIALALRPRNDQVSSAGEGRDK
jgi:hypothetical protein